MKKRIAKGLSGVMACLLSVSICATLLGNEYEGLVNEALGVQSGTIEASADSIVYKSDFTSDGIPSDEGMAALIEAEDAFNKEGMGESAVLVKNNGVLPLASDVKNISLFGRSMVDPVYRCTSAGPTIDENRVIDPAAAMEGAGFSVNETVLEAYSTDSVQRLTGSVQSIGESEISLFTDSVRGSFSSYGDAAIVMFSRLAGEGIDISTSDADGVNQLSLHRQESDLLKMIKGYKDNGVFKNVIVLINSAYAMELDWIFDEAYGVDACLWIGNPGLTGFSAIPELLTGKINPSGHFVDTFAANSLSSAAAQNLGNTAFTNSFETYVVYAEGIYVGYKYYETRYEDLMLGRYNAGAAGLYDEAGNAVSGNPQNAVMVQKAEFDDETYRTTEEGNVVDNKFDEGIFATDYNAFYEDTVTYLTRSDWNTFPRTYDDLMISDEMRSVRSGDFYEELKAIVGEPESHALGQDAGVKFIDMYGVEWEDEEKWNEFLSQLSVGELSLIVSDSWGQKAIGTISKPQNYQCDGPDGGSTKYKYGDGGNNTTYVNQGTMACSWSKELFARRGYFLAEDGFYNNTNCTMGPGVDIHRTPFSGRNHEYYSEDAAISYILGAVQCESMQEKGMVAMLKHICGNDQETNRKGICEFMREQSLREITLKGFEGCMREGGALSAMAAFNCLGVCNVARNYALLTDVVRNEWNWKGFIDTDANDCVDTPEVCVVSGIDEFCLTSAIDKEVAKAANAGDEYLVNALMNTNKRFYYTYLQSNLVNGLTSETQVTSGTSWWQKALIGVDAASGVLMVVSAGLYIGLTVLGKKKRREA